MKRLPILAAVTLLLAGCVADEKPERSAAAGYGRIGQTDFPPLKGAKLSLSPIGSFHFKSGAPAQVSFSLKNLDLKPVRIPEWRMTEVDNIKLYGQPWLPGMDKPDPESWFSFDEAIHTPEMRYQLELLPGNQVIVTKKLDFVESLVVTPGAERRYFFKAELNLTSVTLSTDVFAIAVAGQ